MEETVAGKRHGNIFKRKIHAAEADEQMKAELYQQVGKLQVELDWLKKKSGLSR